MYFGRFALYQKISEKKELTTKEEAEWQRVVNRFDKVCKKAHDLEVSLLIDGEESWMQDAADDLAEEMMRKYNKKKKGTEYTPEVYAQVKIDEVNKKLGTNI